MYFAFNLAWNSNILQLHIVYEEHGVGFFFTYWTKSVKRDKSYLSMIPYYLSLIFSLMRPELLCWFSMFLSIFQGPRREIPHSGNLKKYQFHSSNTVGPLGYSRKKKTVGFEDILFWTATPPSHLQEILDLWLYP